MVMRDTDETRVFPRREVVTVLLVSAIAVAALFVYLMVTPGPYSVHAVEGEAVVTFWTDARWVALPGNCTQVHWQTEAIRAVSYQDESAVGAGDREVCVSAASQDVTLRVRFTDDVRWNYTLSIGVFTLQPLSWILGLALVVLLGVAGYIAFMPNMIAEQPAPSAAKSFVHSLGGALVALMITLLLLEVAMRGFFTISGSQHDQVLYTYPSEEIERFLSANQRQIPLPFVETGGTAANDEHNQLGYRGEDIELPKPDGVFRIVALGDSTTYGTGTSIENTYPAQLQTTLRETYGDERIEVINAGTAGYTSWNMLANFAFRVLELEPDLVIFYMGHTDLLPRMMPADCYRGINPIRGLGSNRVQLENPPINLFPSALYRFVGVQAGWLTDPTLLNVDNNRPAVDCADGAGNDAANIAANAPVYFERNLRNMIAIAQANDVEVLVSSFAYFPEFYELGEGVELRTRLDEHNAIIERVALEMSAPFYDFRNALAEDAGLWSEDGIHLNNAGSQEQARQYAVFLEEQGLLLS